MRRPLGHLGLILGSASLLLGCPGDDDGGGSGETGTASATMTTTMTMTMDPMTDTANESSGEPDTGSTSDGDTTGDTTGGPGESSGSTSGASTGAAGGDFVINLIGYGPHDGDDVFVKLFDDEDEEIGELVGVVTGDPYTLTLPGVIADGESYTVRWFVDFNGSGSCEFDEGGGEDHMWEMADQVGTASGLTVDHTHDTNFTDVCPYWRK